MKRCLCLLILAVPVVAASPAQAQPTRDQYILEADLICADSLLAQQRALRGVLSDVKKGKLKKAARKFRRAVGIYSRGVDQLAALEPPAADRSLITQWVESLRAQLPTLNRFARALARGKPRRLIKLAKQMLNNAMRSWALVENYGFQVCDKY